jgi:diaminohydroxyphosphoribosylaminopyrimidine deaminase/5-amino-6-(5-phosphoribosylamino)uracil reductase
MDYGLYIHKTLLLAKQGHGRVSPNPKVGAVVIKDNEVIAEGYHACFGGSHAEIAALQNLSFQESDGAALCVNLEPCVHSGKTPPCTEAIIHAGIRRVIYGMNDPNPLVSGRGIMRLQEAGIEVIGPVLEDECLQFNAGFVKSIVEKIPYLTVKIAQTLDGRIAFENGKSRWITGEQSREAVHRLRSEYDAVMVGIQTVLQDDPELNVRMTEGLSPKKVILDSRLRIPLNARLFCSNPEKTWIITEFESNFEKKKQLLDRGVHVVEAPLQNGLICLDSVWSILIENGICSILIEGGQKVISYFIRQKLADRFVAFIAPKIFGQGPVSIEDLKINEPDALSFKSVTWRPSGDDMCFQGEFRCLQDLLKKSELSLT